MIALLDRDAIDLNEYLHALALTNAVTSRQGPNALLRDAFRVGDAPQSSDRTRRAIKGAGVDSPVACASTGRAGSARSRYGRASSSRLSLGGPAPRPPRCRTTGSDTRCTPGSLDAGLHRVSKRASVQYVPALRVQAALTAHRHTGSRGEGGVVRHGASFAAACHPSDDMTLGCRSSWKWESS